MPTTAWAVGAAERRCDGGRVTELVKAKDWLAMHGDSRGPEVNPLEPSIKGDMPPALPTYLSRDHLHDRNRQNALFDPAQPGLETYVRVTRRRAPPETEAWLAKQCQERMKVWQQKEAIATSEAHELLELRSMGVRSALQANEMANARISAGEWKPNQPAQPPTQRELRAAELHKKLGIDKVQLVTSPLHIDDTPQAGHNTAFQWMPEAGSGSFAPPDGLDPMAQAPGPAAMTKRAPMRGGAWPVNDNYFEYKKPPPSPKAVKKEDQLHNMGAFAPSSTRAATRASA